LFDNGSSGTSLECFDVGNSEFKMRSMVESSGISAGPIVGMWSVQGTDVVGFSVIIPSNNLEVFEAVLELEDLFPSVVPESLGVEEPVLGVGNFFAKVGEDCQSALKTSGDDSITYTKGTRAPYNPSGWDR